MTTTPAVSVVMPVYNGARFVAEAIESILGQTVRDFEFVIVDDGSTDNTSAILQDYQKRDSRIVLRRQQNKGVSAALNLGISVARGPLIARLDADDTSLPHRLERQLGFLSAHPEVGAVGSYVQRMDEAGHLLDIRRYPTAPALVAWSMLFFNPLVHPSVTVRRAALERVGLYPLSRRLAQDYALFARMSRVCLLANVAEVLLRYRVSTSSLTSTAWEEQEYDAARILRESMREWWRIDVTHEEAVALRGLSRDRYPDTAAECKRLHEVVLTCLTSFADDSRFTGQELRLVRSDAAIRLWLLAMLALRRSALAGISLAIPPTRIAPFSGLLFLIKVCQSLGQRVRGAWSRSKRSISRGLDTPE